MSVTTIRAAEAGRLRRNWKPFYWLLGVLLLLIAQLLSGTDPIYALLVFVFLSLTWLTVKALGGPASLLGICVTILALQHVIVSQIAKILFGQPGDSMLIRPIETMAAYVISMAGIYLAANASRLLGLIHPRPLFASEVNPRRLYWMALVCTLFAAGRLAIIGLLGADADTGKTNVGGMIGPLRTMTFLTPLAVACGTAYVIVASRGRKSVGLLNALAIIVPFAFGLIGATRASMSLPFVAYLVTCYAFGFKFRPVHWVVILGGAYLAQFVLFPYALLARDVVRTPRFADNVRLSMEFFQEVLSDPVKYQAIQNRKDTQISKRFLYYGRPAGTLDRYSIIISTDGIVEATLENGTTGMETITPGFVMLLPRFLNQDKPVLGTSNFLAHRAPGMVGDKDKVTQITLGFIPDAFSSYGWLGVAVIPFLLTLCFFTVVRLLFDDLIWNNVLAIAFSFIWPWDFSEGTIATNLLMVFQGPLIVGAVYWLIWRLVNILERAQTKGVTVAASGASEGFAS